jgi:hypothetical protein
MGPYWLATCGTHVLPPQRLIAVKMQYNVLTSVDLTESLLNAWKTQITWLPSAPASWSNADACNWGGITCIGQDVQSMFVLPSLFLGVCDCFSYSLASDPYSA